MKTAVTSNGSRLVASQASPNSAVCPKCGGAVILKTRRLMANAGTTYYWRHEDNDHSCTRQKPFMRLRNGDVKIEQKEARQTHRSTIL